MSEKSYFCVYTAHSSQVLPCQSPVLLLTLAGLHCLYIARWVLHSYKLTRWHIIALFEHTR